MNIQTERLENHTARFTVEVESERLDAAKKAAAKKIARQVRIPGFRKGKAPYKVMVNYVGEAAILEDAIEDLGNEIYSDVLKESDVQPYGPGSLEDFQVEPQPVFKFVVPLQPTVDLGAYRDIRIDYEAAVVEDSDVDEALKALQEREALIEESSKPVAAGNRVTVSIKGEYLDSEDGADDETAEEAADDAGDEEETGEDTPSNNVFIENDQVIFSLTEDNEPAPGFTEALAGANVGDRREFEITYPDDEDEYQHLSGRHVKFDVTIKKIETVTLPELNDAFAARVGESEQEEGDEPQSLLQLRMKIRKDLEEQAEEQAKAEYAQGVLESIMDQATFAYPEALVSDQVHHILHHLDQDLRQRGLTLDDYMKVMGKSHEDLHEDYNDSAIETIKRSLTIRELIDIEQIEVTESDIDSEIDRVVAQFGEQAAAFRSIYNNPTVRENLSNDLLTRKVMDRIASIARGDNPEIGAAQEEPAAEVVSLEAETEADEVEMDNDSEDEGDSA